MKQLRADRDDLRTRLELAERSAESGPLAALLEDLAGEANRLDALAKKHAGEIGNSSRPDKELGVMEAHHDDAVALRAMLAKHGGGS
jgi:hypothetical protein